MARTPIMAGNWKMHLAPAEAATLATAIRERTETFTQVARIVCPPFPSLPAVKASLAGSTLQIGGQNLHAEDSGAYTGEVSGPMLAGLVSHVILGHSERRTYCHESDLDVHHKVLAALRAGLTPILCVGESAAENQANETRAVITRQVTTALKDVAATDAASLVIAYEPVWAIGTGLAATPDLANEVCGEVIRLQIADLYDGHVAESVRILYGGSTNPDNIAAFMATPDIDGALIGGAALSVDSYSSMVVQTARSVT